MMTEEASETFEDFTHELDDLPFHAERHYFVSEILFLLLTALICGAEGWQEVERFGKLKLPFLRNFFPYSNGIPLPCLLRDFFRALSPTLFRTFFFHWLQNFLPFSLAEKTFEEVSFSYEKIQEAHPFHKMTVYPYDTGLVFSQENLYEDLSPLNASTLLPLLDIKDALITLKDQEGAKDRAHFIKENHGAYLFSLKDTKSSLLTDIQLLFQDKDLLQSLEPQSYKAPESTHESFTEERTYVVLPCPTPLKETHAWPHVHSLIQLTRHKGTPEDVTTEREYALTSLPLSPSQIAAFMKPMETLEHTKVLGVCLQNTRSKICQGNAPRNIATLKHMAFNLIKRVQKDQQPLKQLSKAAFWDDTLLLTILFQKLAP